jgi:hypothetical protein
MKMDLLAYFENWEGQGRGLGMVCVWDLSSETRPLIAHWDVVKVDDIWVSSLSMLVGIMSTEPNTDSTICIFEIPSKTLVAEIHFGFYVGFLHHFTCNFACDKVAVARGEDTVGYDVSSGNCLYEFADANEMVFSYDNRFVYVKYEFKVAQCDVTSGQELASFEEFVNPTCFCCFQQNPSGTRLTWLQVVSKNDSAADSSLYDMVVLDTTSGQILQTWRTEFGWVAGFRDDEVAIAVIEDCVQYYNIETAEMTPTGVKKSLVHSADVIDGITTAFDATPGRIQATDLATGTELYSLDFPNQGRTYRFNAIRVSVNNIVLLL